MLRSFTKKMTRAQVSHPFIFLGAALIVTAVAGLAASGLWLDSSYEALLPRGAPELQNVNEVRDKTGGTRQLVVAISGSDQQARLEFGRRLLKRIRRLEHVRHGELEYPVEFFRERAAWLMADEDIDELVPALERGVELARNEGDMVGLGLAWSRIGDVLESSKLRLSEDGILSSRDGQTNFLIIVPSINFYDIAPAQELLDQIDGAVATLDPSAAGVEVRYAGNLIVTVEQQQVMTRDVSNAAILALILGVLLIAAVTRRLLAPVVIGIVLVAGLTWTFGIAFVIFGHLNVITGFLIAVLIGLGLDFGIHLYVRFCQESSRSGVAIHEAIRRSVVETSRPALTSALTTGGTFLTFALAQFRGFSEFGLIASCGVLLTFLSSFLLLPPLLVVAGRLGLVRAPRCSSGRLSGVLGARLRVPWPVALGVVLAFATTASVGLSHVTDIPFQNDFRRLRGVSEATEFTEYVDSNLGSGFNPAVILVGSVDEARQVSRIVSDQIELAEPGSRAQINSVLSIADLMPHDSEHRAAQLRRLSEILADPALDRFVEGEPARAAQIALGRRIAASNPWTVDEIPQEFRRRFITPDGRQFMVYIWPREANVTDQQAVAWEHELQALQDRFSAAGIATRVADETLFTAWVYRLVSGDGPKLIMMTSALVFLFLLFDLRSLWRALLVMTPLSLGMLTFVGALHVFGLEINLFNLIVIPSIVGIGIDNAVHIYHRYRCEGRGSALLVIGRTGVAASLASLTTGVGFGSSLISHHVGLQSMGIVAILGIGSTLLASVVFFPCLLTLLELMAPVRAHLWPSRI